MISVSITVPGAEELVLTGSTRLIFEAGSVVPAAGAEDVADAVTLAGEATPQDEGMPVNKDELVAIALAQASSR